MKYEISDANEITIWLSEGEGQAKLVQPSWPDRTPWASREEAESWAQMQIAAIENEELPLPPLGPGKPMTQRPDPETTPTPLSQAQLERYVQTRIEQALAERDSNATDA